MSERHWPGTALAMTALALLGTVVVTGCGNSASTTHASTTPASATETAGVAATGHRTYTASQLRRALLARVGGQRPAAATEAGDYGTLPDVQTTKLTMKEVTVRPARCAGAAATGLDSASFSRAPAAVVTFRVGRDGVSEVLVSATSQLAATALSEVLPGGCGHYTATADGKTFSYSVREAPLSGVADQAVALNVKATGYAEVDVWSVLYRASGFVGAVTMVGPDASELGVTQLARDAYAHAGQSLPQV
jgi:hypothetical protein